MSLPVNVAKLQSKSATCEPLQYAHFYVAPACLAVKGLSEVHVS